MVTRSIACALLATLLAVSSAAQTGVPLSQVTLVERQVEQGGEVGGWRGAKEGEPLNTGESLRTAETGLARIELPWMSLTLSPASTLSLPDDFILSAVLARERVRIASGERDMLKLLTAEAEVRGRGEAVELGR